MPALSALRRLPVWPARKHTKAGAPLSLGRKPCPGRVSLPRLSPSPWASDSLFGLHNMTCEIASNYCLLVLLVFLGVL